MKKIFLFLGFCTIGVNSFAQKETFDLTTFTPPKGWKKEVFPNSAIRFTTTNGGSYCILGIYHSTDSKGTLEADFNEEWEELVVKSLNPDSVSDKQKAEARNGYSNMIGVVPFPFNGGQSLAMLSVYSGYGKRTSILILSNDPEYFNKLDSFIASVRLSKPTSKTTNGNTGNNDAGSSTNSALTHIWKQTSNTRDGLGNYGGYSSTTYEFRANNTYKFSKVNFQSYTPKYYLEDEEGTYTVTGNLIILSPKKSRFHSHQRNVSDPVLKSGNLDLRVVKYAFQITIINDKQTVLLSPVDGKETRRDGVFSFWMNGEKTRSYAYYQQ